MGLFVWVRLRALGRIWRSHRNQPPTVDARHNAAGSLGRVAGHSCRQSTKAWPDLNLLLRATVLTELVVMLDAIVVALLLERSYAMFRSLIGTWLPFAAIFLAGIAAGR